MSPDGHPFNRLIGVLHQRITDHTVDELPELYGGTAREMLVDEICKLIKDHPEYWVWITDHNDNSWLWFGAYKVSLMGSVVSKATNKVLIKESKRISVLVERLAEESAKN